MEGPGKGFDTAVVAPLSLTAQRVVRDVDVLARAGLDLPTFFEEAAISIARALPYSAACVATTDPTTNLLTGTWKYGSLRGNDVHDHAWGLMEYGAPEDSAFL